MRKTVLLKGPTLSMSGYGQHSRQIFRWLMKKDVDLLVQATPWGSTSWHINEKGLSGLVGEIMKRTVGNLPKRPDVSLQVILPNEWDINAANVNVGVSAFVETDVCNPKWIEDCNRMSHIVVPSKHIKETIERTGRVKVPLDVVPEAYIDQIRSRNEVTEEPLLDLKTDFNFLILGQLTGNNNNNDRKNTYNTLKWLCEAFKNDPNVGIVIKTNTGTGTTIDRANTYNALKACVSSVRKGDYPRVTLLHGAMEEEEVARLYRHPKIKACINLTRGEGFGLPLLEAAASDLPVIATNWSGHLDFMKMGKFIPINYELKEIDRTRVDGSIFVRGARWAEASEDDFKKKVKKFKDNFDMPTKWAQDLGLKLRESHSQENIEKIYDQILGHLL